MVKQLNRNKMKDFDREMTRRELRSLGFNTKLINDLLNKPVKKETAEGIGRVYDLVDDDITIGTYNPQGSKLVLETDTVNETFYS